MNNSELLEQIAGLCRLDMSAEWRAARIVELMTDTNPPDNAGEIVRPYMNTYNVEMIIGDIYRVTVTAPNVAAAELLAMDIDVTDDMEQIRHDVAIIDDGRVITSGAYVTRTGR